MSSEKKCVTLSIGQKKELCLKKANNPFMLNTELAKYYNIKPNTVNEAVSIWMSQFLSMNQTLREDILQQKAKLFANKFSITGFNASAG
ncbi:14550_t:CDS:2, partial [Funneliformis geosporum]